MSRQRTLTFETEVDGDGRVEVATLLPPRARVTVLITPHSDEFRGLLEATESTLSVWENPLDDEDWNVTS